jgi:hypothetical protein
MDQHIDALRKHYNLSSKRTRKRRFFGHDELRLFALTAFAKSASFENVSYEQSYIRAELGH